MKIENKNETLIVSEGVDINSLDPKTLVETNEEYSNRVAAEKGILPATKTPDKKRKKRKKTDNNKKNSKNELKINNLPIFNFWIQENYHFVEEHASVFSPEKFEAKYEVTKVNFSDNGVDVFNVTLEIMMPVASALWFAKLVSVTRDLRYYIKFTGLIENVTFEFMRLISINMIKNEYGVATCEIKFYR